MKKILAALLVLLFGALVVGAVLWSYGTVPVREEATPQAKKKLSVVATFYPLAFLAEEIGGDRVAAENITPPGAEPHDYEPTPKDIEKLYSADVVLVNGSGLDAWAENQKAALEEKGVKVLVFSDGLELLPGEEAEHEEEASPQEGTIPQEEKSQHEENLYDPHVWLDPVLYGKGGGVLAKTLRSIDPEDASYFAVRLQAFQQKIAALDKDYSAGLQSCHQDTIFTSHQAFAYLAKRYGFDTLSISGLAPEAEPSPKRLAELATLAEEKGIKYVFFETLVSPRVAETLAQEIGASTLVFNPLEGLTDEEKGAGKDYFSIMEENLANLKLALECQP